MSTRQPFIEELQDPEVAAAAAAEVDWELSQINPAVLLALKQQVGLGDKDYHSLTTKEKARIIINKVSDSGS